MKKLLMILVLTLIPALLFSQTDLEQGKRNLKLGMTYLQAENLPQAEKYINEGYVQVSNSKSPDAYWSAVGYEYKGYLAHKKGNLEEAVKNFDLAIKIYKKIITQTDGSPEAVAQLEATVKKLEDLIKSPKGPSDISECIDGSDVLNYDRAKFEEVFYQIPKNVVNLSMSDCKVKDLYPFYDFTKLKYLNLSNNSIKTIPPGLSKLKCLKYLSFNNNKLKKISVAEFAGLKNLKVLDLRNNNLTSDAMFQLVRLLPNTNIMMDEYEKVEEEEEGEVAPGE